MFIRVKLCLLFLLGSSILVGMFPIRPTLSPSKFLCPCDSALEETKVTQVRQFKHLSRNSQDKAEKSIKNFCFSFG